MLLRRPSPPRTRPAGGTPRGGAAATDARVVAARARRIWSAAAALALVTIALRLWVELAVRPYSWTLPGWAGIPLLAVAVVAAAAAPVALYVRLVLSQPPPRALPLSPAARPAWWLPRRGLVALPSPWLAAPALLYLALVAGAVPLRAAPGGRLTVGWESLVSGVWLLQPLVAAVVWYVVRGPQLGITAAGLVVRGPWSGPAGRTVPWSAVDLAAVAGVRRRLLPVGRDEAGPVVLRLGWLWVDPLFLARALRHYAEHPEHRADLGTELEQTRLRAALATLPDPPADRWPETPPPAAPARPVTPPATSIAAVTAGGAAEPADGGAAVPRPREPQPGPSARTS
ncbi:hypothetical protein GCM10010123_22370 [Pilimelia anulata]|uniref:Uncharacterized protein n=1 Tax=Pilimelia anulata TaxID=53371 RepID=A0A8J3B360_9ACTN|nr:hypothetical protein [Pilimelia anulata]GGJ92092.1 hypothetical protein GCM10010123_22370 [Pilimelia anulata]